MPPPLPPLAPLPFVVAPQVPAPGLPGPGRVYGGVGWGGRLTLVRVPSPGASPWGGRCLYSPRQGVTLLYGPSTCTRSVQMALRRSQVLRPFPAPGLGTLKVAGESLRDRPVSCLPRWTVCPTCRPSPGTNRSTCLEIAPCQAHWSPPQGRCQLGPLTNGPGRIRPYCVCSGRTDTGIRGAPEPLGLGPSPASPVGSLLPDPPLPLCWPRPLRSLPSFFPLPALFFCAPRLLQCPAWPSLSPSARPRTGTMHDSCRAGFRLGLRVPAFRPPCLLHITLAGPVFAPVPRLPLRLYLATAPLLPLSPSRKPLRRPRGAVLVHHFLGDGGRGGGGAGGGRSCSPFLRACTLRAPCPHVAWHLSAGGALLPLLCSFPLGSPARHCSAWALVLCREGFVLSFSRAPLAPLVPAAGGKHDARTRQAQSPSPHGNHNVFRLEEWVCVHMAVVAPSRS